MPNILQDFKKDSCCGCSACKAVCPKDALSLSYDEQGFLYPQIDESKCIDCGLCMDVCPSHATLYTPLDKCYAVKRKDREKLLTSTSGGFAASLSEAIIKEGGIVYGVAYDQFPHVGTIRCTTSDEIESLKGSKYVQTDPKESFREVAEDLKIGKEVAYFSTSCHVNGLLNFLQKKRVSTDKLITIDLVCHGVPSPRLFEEYIAWLSKKRHIEHFYFRTKRNGWGGGSVSCSPSIRYKNEVVCNTSKAWGYMKLFFSNNCLRPFCYGCPYAGKGRPADFTIADYWDVEKVMPEFYTPDGVSLVFVNSKNALRHLDAIKEDYLEIKESKFGLGMERQANLWHPSQKASSYDEFWRDYQTGGISFVSKKYGGVTLKNQILKSIKNTLVSFGLWK